AHGHTCADWIRIPLSSIEDVRVVRLVPCDGHRHPFVDLVLKPPATDEGVLFASLAQASHGRARRAGSTRTFGRYSPAISTPPERSSVSEARAIPHGPDAGDLLPSCSGCPAWVDDHGWFGILVGCSDTTCDYAEY
ncbi:MAG TPA: hypothetical protein VFU98_04335, partial [Microlunatus sp.]|nr:hypothetical protein [Microlunatus sp.]